MVLYQMLIAVQSEVNAKFCNCSEQTESLAKFSEKDPLGWLVLH